MDMDVLTPNNNQSIKTNKRSLKSLRFQLSLKHYGDTECPEFSYTELVKDKIKVILNILAEVKFHLNNYLIIVYIRAGKIGSF